MNNSPNVQNNMSQQVPVMNGNINGGVRVKTEPGMESPTMGMSQAPYQNPTLSMPVAATAQQRAAQHLQANYGPRAAASINAIQGGAQPVQQQNGQQPQNIQQMRMQEQQQHAMRQQQMQQMQAQQQQQQSAGQMPPQRPTMTQEQYRQAMANQAQKQMQSQTGAQPGQNGVGAAQTDGAGDDDFEFESTGLIKQVGANGEETTMGRIEVDGLIRQKIEAMGHKMEGGGLMLPLKQASTPAKRQRKVTKSSSSLAQNDGPGSDEVKGEEFDEDAINSDLDDPDDGANDDDDDEDGMGHIMLCMYDKVQRVKNKW